MSEEQAAEVAMATELPITSAPATSPARPRWAYRERGEVIAQLIVSGGPLLIGALFPIGKPVYSTLFGEIGKYNCASYVLFNRPCPACGLTSGVVSALHGRLDLSVAYHPLGWAFTLFFIVGFIAGLLKWRRLLRPALDAPAALESWLLEFPSASWMTILTFGFFALIAGRTVFWLGEVL